MLTSRPCYFCGMSPNRIILDEPCEIRFGRPVMPEGRYRLARCRACKALYVDSNVNEAYLVSLYADETEAGIATITKGIDHDTILSSRMPEFARHWRAMRGHRPPTVGDRLLDLGCQTGDFGSLVAVDGVAQTGIELSREYAEKARRSWGVGALVYEQVSDLPASEGSFAYITAFETLEHMIDPIAMLKRCRSWVQRDGMLAISVPSVDYFRGKAEVLKRLRATSSLGAHNKPGTRTAGIPHTHIYTFSATACRLALDAGGFRAVYLTSTGWHGALRFGNTIAGLVTFVSKRRVFPAPSIFLIAVPV